jgi:glycerol-3-phosphate dehydrogenase
VFGGKITTYRRLAEAVLSKLHPHIGGAKQTWTDLAPLPGGDLPHNDFEAFVNGARRRWPFLPPDLARRLCHAYGTRISDIVGASRNFEDLGFHFGAGLTRAELDYLRSHEWAQTVEDVLWRRSKLGLHISKEGRAELARYVGEPATTRVTSKLEVS